MSSTEDTENIVEFKRDPLEIADFQHLAWKLDVVNINPDMLKLLEKINQKPLRLPSWVPPKHRLTNSQIGSTGTTADQGENGEKKEGEAADEANDNEEGEEGEEEENDDK